MSTYIFDGITLPRGTLNITLINDVGTSTEYVTGKRVINVASLRRSLEENGVGGIMRIDDMELELDDPDNILHDTVFQSSVETVFANITLTSGATEYSVMYGIVSLPSISYEEWANDGSDIRRYCKFTATSPVLSLQEVTLDEIRAECDTETWRVTNGIFTLISIQDLLTVTISKMTTDVPVVVDYTGMDYLFYRLADTYPLSQVYLYMKETNPFTLISTYIGLFSNTESKSFMQIGSGLELLKMLCTALLLVPIVTYSPTTNQYTVTFKHRHNGTVVTPSGVLKTSTETPFIGYDAGYIDSIDPDHPNVGIDRRVFNRFVHGADDDFTNSISDTQINALKQVYRFKNYLYFGDDSEVNFFTIVIGSRNQVRDWDVIRGTSLNQSLIRYFKTNWGRTKTSFERTYSGCSLVDGIKLLDKVTIGGTDYSYYEIEDNFVDDEFTYKATQFLEYSLANLP